MSSIACRPILGDLHNMAAFCEQVFGKLLIGRSIFGQQHAQSASCDGGWRKLDGIACLRPLILAGFSGIP